MPIIPLSREMGEYLQSKCDAFVRDGKGKRLPDELVRCVHDGSKSNSKSYAQVYVLNVKRDNPLEPNKAKVRFFYHTASIEDREGKREVERCEIKASEEAIRLVGDTFEVGGYLRKIGMHFMDSQGNIDVIQLKAVFEMAAKIVEGKEASEIKIILDKQ
jgi:hypothetical protein